MADNTAYTKVLPLNPVQVSTVFKQTSTPYGLRGMAILKESDHEGIQSYRNMSALEQDYDIDTDVWKQANAYFTGLNAYNGLVQVISYDRNYGKGSPLSPNIPGKVPGSNPTSGNNNSSDDKKGGAQ